MRLAPLCVLCLALTSCGSDKDDDKNDDGSADATAASLHGIYERKSVKSAYGGCDDAKLKDDTNSWSFPDLYFRYGTRDFFGSAVPMAYSGCTSPEVCKDSMHLSWTFSEIVDGRWHTDGKSSSPSGSKPGQCYFSFSNTWGTFADGTATLRRETHSGVVECAESDKLDALYEANKDKLPCSDLLVVTAVKIR